MEQRRLVQYSGWAQPLRPVRCILGWVLLLVFTFLFSVGHAAQPDTIEFNAEQRTWLAQHKEQSFSVGFDPFGGVDSFELRGQRMGFLHLLLEDIQKRTGLKLTPAESSGWDDAYRKNRRLVWCQRHARA